MSMSLHSRMLAAQLFGTVSIDYTDMRNWYSERFVTIDPISITTGRFPDYIDLCKPVGIFIRGGNILVYFQDRYKLPVEVVIGDAIVHDWGWFDSLCDEYLNRVLTLNALTEF